MVRQFEQINYLQLSGDLTNIIFSVLCLCGKDVSDRRAEKILKEEGGLIAFDRIGGIVEGVPTITEEQIIRAFRTFDINGDNSISLSELRVLLQRLGDKMSDSAVAAVFSSLDANKDGKLDYREFAGLYSKANIQLNHILQLRQGQAQSAAVTQKPSTNPSKPAPAASPNYKKPTPATAPNYKSKQTPAAPNYKSPFPDMEDTTTDSSTGTDSETETEVNSEEESEIQTRETDKKGIPAKRSALPEKKEVVKKDTDKVEPAKKANEKRDVSPAKTVKRDVSPAKNVKREPTSTPSKKPSEKNDTVSSKNEPSISKKDAGPSKKDTGSSKKIVSEKKDGPKKKEGAEKKDGKKMQIPEQKKVEQKKSVSDTTTTSESDDDLVMSSSPVKKVEIGAREDKATREQPTETKDSERIYRKNVRGCIYAGK
eukprot:sb/3464962/